ncbi:MAG TPA: hypothetical protein V6D25_30965 [Leptolyngbyaceae cyanobacterium]
MTHPIGFYAARPQGHPDHEILTKLEAKFGSYFQQLSTIELCTLMTYCSLEVEGHYRNLNPGHECVMLQEDFWEITLSLKIILSLVSVLTHETRLDLMPFLCEQIRNRPR